MTGEQLYALYREKNLERGCDTDAWDDIDTSEREVWSLMATSLINYQESGDE